MMMLFKDIKFSFQQLNKNPGFTVIAVLTLALGVGSTTAVFGIINELLFKPRAVSRPDELAAVGFRSEDGSLTMPTISRPFYEVFRAEQQSFSDLIGYAFVGFTMAKHDGSEVVRGELVSGSYFQTLGVKPVLGRSLLPADDAKPGQGMVAVISHAFWQRHFHADPNAIGQTLRLENQAVEIVGVAPKAFTGLDARSADLWLNPGTIPANPLRLLCAAPCCLLRRCNECVVGWKRRAAGRSAGRLAQPGNPGVWKRRRSTLHSKPKESTPS